MSGDQIFESSVQVNGDLAGVFEYDGTTGYFYLYDKSKDAGSKVVDAINILSGRPDFEPSDLSIVWNKWEDAVGLYVRQKLWAVFDNKGRKYGGNYKSNSEPNIPEDVKSRF
jgi:hypothetical protein